MLKKEIIAFKEYLSKSNVVNDFNELKIVDIQILQIQ